MPRHRPSAIPSIHPVAVALFLTVSCGSDSDSEPGPSITSSTDSTTTDTTSTNTTSAGTIEIDPSPDALSAPWTLSGPSGYGTSGSGDATVVDLGPGAYTVVWGDVADWTTPSAETQSLAEGATVTFDGMYVPSGPSSGPRIDAASGEVAQGEELQLTGEGFGVKDPVAPVLYDDFESGTVGADVLGFAGSPWDNQYAYGPEAYVRYSDAMAAEGRGMCAEVFHPTAANLIYLMKNYTPTGKFYFDADHKMVFPEIDQGVVTTQCKPVRVRRQSDQGLSLYSGRTMCDDDGNQSGADGGYGVDNPAAIAECGTEMTDMGWTVPFGWLNWTDWITWQWIYGEGTPGQADAYSRVEYDCVLKNETHGLCDIETGGESWDQLIVGGQASTVADATCPGGTLGAYTYWDHVYFDTTWQRIELGNSPVYGSCTIRAIQLPLDWSSGTIVVRLNLGQLDPSAEIYAFVIDEENRPSNGLLLTGG